MKDINTPHIYLADDDEDDRFFLEEAFSVLYPEVKILEFEDGQAIVDNLNSKESIEKPSLILLDCNMPYLTGVDVLKHLQAQEEYKDVAKVMWSVSDKLHTIEECMDNGATDFYKKPADMEGYKKIASTLFFLMTKRLG